MNLEVFSISYQIRHTKTKEKGNTNFDCYYGQVVRYNVITRSRTVLKIRMLTLNPCLCKGRTKIPNSMANTEKIHEIEISKVINSTEQVKTTAKNKHFLKIFFTTNY